MITVERSPLEIHRERILFAADPGQCLGMAEKEEAAEYGQSIAGFI